MFACTPEGFPVFVSLRQCGSRKRSHPTVEGKSDHLDFSVPRAQQVRPGTRVRKCFSCGRG